MEQENADRLEELLEAVVNDASIAEHPVDWLPTDCPELIEAINNEPAFALFDNTLQVCGTDAQRYGRGELSKWLYTRGKKVGATKAIEEIRLYVEEPYYHAYKVALVIGLGAYQEFDCDGGLRIGRPGSVPIEKIKDELIRRQIIPFLQADGVIVQHVLHPRLHIQSDGEFRIPEDILSDDIEDFLLCFSLAGNRGPQLIARTLTPVDEVPHRGYSWTMHSYRASKGIVPPLSTEEVESANAIAKRFRELPAEARDHLLIPMQRLNLFFSEKTGSKRPSIFAWRSSLSSSTRTAMQS